MNQSISDTELSELVAEKIMGWKVQTKEYPPDSGSFVSYYVNAQGEFTFQIDGWQPATDGNQMIMAQTKFFEDHPHVEMTTTYYSLDKSWTIFFLRPGHYCRSASAKSEPRSMCLAMLAVIEREGTL